MSLNHLELQLNLLSLGHLSPSIIAPHDLRRMLRSVSQALPDKFKLASEPDKDIWHYYRILSCSTLFDKRSIVIVVEVPLLDRDNSYILYRILNFPLPLPTRQGIRRESKLAAKFKLEAEMIAVSGSGTEYILLNHNEAARCAESVGSVCQVSGPVYTASSRSSCEMSLFRRKTAEIQKNCQVTVHTNIRLPMAMRLSKGSWMVATDRDIDFRVLCGDNNRSRIVAEAPIATIRIDRGCVAHSDYMRLTAQVNGNSKFRRVEQLHVAPINMSIPTVWFPVMSRFPNFSTDGIPSELGKMVEIPIQKLLEALEGVERKREKRREIPAWVIVVSSLAGTGVLIVIVLVVKRVIERKQEGSEGTQGNRSEVRQEKQEHEIPHGRVNQRQVTGSNYAWGEEGNAGICKELRVWPTER